MSFIDILFVAIGLAMDSFAVSITSGFSQKKIKASFAFKVALYFGFFQGFMPVLGWFSGVSFKDYVSNFDHWIAFILLCFIGLKMIYESVSEKGEDEKINYNKHGVLFTLAIATSIDALAVGISFSFLNISILNPIIIIGLVTFLLSFVGVYLGKKFGHLIENKVEIVGGLILIGIGTKILLEHIL